MMKLLPRVRFLLVGALFAVLPVSSAFAGLVGGNLPVGNGTVGSPTNQVKDSGIPITNVGCVKSSVGDLQAATDVDSCAEVTVLGYATAGDAPVVTYAKQGSPCSVDGGYWSAHRVLVNRCSP